MINGHSRIYQKGLCDTVGYCPSIFRQSYLHERLAQITRFMNVLCSGFKFQNIASLQFFFEGQILVMQYADEMPVTHHQDILRSRLDVQLGSLLIFKPVFLLVFKLLGN